MKSSPPGVALLLVRNAVSHDARVLRAANTLQDLGFTVLVCGVVSTSERQTRLEIGGIQIVRLDPGGGIRSIVGRRGRPARSREGNRVEAVEPSNRNDVGLGRPSNRCDVRPGQSRGGADVGLAPMRAGGGERSEPHAGAPPTTGSDGDRLVPGIQTRLAERVKRQALTVAFYLQGISLAWRTSPALVHANDYNTMWIGIAAKFLRGSGLIYDSHELWADRNGRPEWRPWLLACEALFVRLSDATITASPGYAAAIASRYRLPAPMVIRNIPITKQGPHTFPRGRASCVGADAQVSGVAAGADASGVAAGAHASGVAAGADASGVAAGARVPGVAVYLGGLMPGRGLEQAIEAVALVPQLRLRLIGPGRDSYRAVLQRRIDAAAVTDRVEICPAVPPAEILTAIADADMGLMLIQPVCRSYELTLPNKLFEYAAAGLPILSSNLPVIGALVASEGLGEVVPADDIELIAEGLKRLADPEVNAMRRQRVAAFAQGVTWEQERAILSDVYRQVSRNGPQPKGVASDERWARGQGDGEPQTEDNGEAEAEAEAEREPDGERLRVTQVYGGYSASPRKRRSWSTKNPGNVAIRTELVDAAFALAAPGLAAARDILDIGCGSGWWLERLDGDARVLAGLYGLELLPERAVAARARVPAAVIRVGDVRELPFEPHGFDVVTMFTVLSSLPSIDAVEVALGEARRVLRSGGMLIVWEPRLPTPLNRHTLRINDRLLRRTLAGACIQARTITVMPPLARRLGARTELLYPRLAQVPALRTHRLTCARIP